MIVFKRGRRNVLVEYARFCWKAQAPRIVFFAEDGGSWPHFEGLVGELVSRGRSVVYLTSSPSDPVLDAEQEGIEAYWIGDGFTRNVLFQGLKRALLIMTMPDLQTFHIKRSLFSSTTHYLYLFHSIASSHMIYREEAFDHFDTILCTGPHHLDEIRRRERLHGLKPKRLVEYGYGNLDALISAADDLRQAGGMRRTNGPIRVLVAPSWGPHGILESLGEELSSRLLDAGYQITIRPHPRTELLTPSVIDGLRQRFQFHDRFRLDLTTSRDSLFRADVMISDYSGVAFEYAFGLEKPVLFVDVEKKVNNPRWEALGAAPVEVALRREVGYLIEPSALDGLPTLIDRILNEADQWSMRLRTLRKRIVYNVSASATVGADIVESLFDELFG